MTADEFSANAHQIMLTGMKQVALDAQMTQQLERLSFGDVPVMPAGWDPVGAIKADLEKSVYWSAFVQGVQTGTIPKNWFGQHGLGPVAWFHALNFGVNKGGAVYCKCWMCLNTGPNGECEKCGLPPSPERINRTGEFRQ